MISQLISFMSENHIATITIALGSFFFFLSLLLIYFRIRAYQKRMNATKSIIKDFPQLSQQHKENMERLPISQKLVSNFKDDTWNFQKETYQSICKAATSPSMKGLSKFPTALKKLVSLYQNTLMAVEKLAIEGEKVLEIKDELTKSQNDLKKANEENDELNKEINSLAERLNERCNFENGIIEDLAKMISEKPRLELSATLGRFEKHYQYLRNTLEEKLMAFNYENDDEFNQSKALIDQLRHEKIELNHHNEESIELLNYFYYKFILKQKNSSEKEGKISLSEIKEAVKNLNNRNDDNG